MIEYFDIIDCKKYTIFKILNLHEHLIFINVPQNIKYSTSETLPRRRLDITRILFSKIFQNKNTRFLRFQVALCNKDM